MLTRLPGGYLTIEEWGRLGVFLAVSVLYLACFFSLGLFASSITDTSASSLVIAIMIWCLMVLAIPNFGNTLAHKIKVVRSAQQMELELSRIWIRDIYEMHKARREGTGKPRNEFSNTNAEFDKLRNDVRSDITGLIFLSMNLTRLSPAGVYTFLSADVAGTGIIDNRKAKDAVIEYKNQVWNRISGNDIIAGDPISFSYKRRSIRDVLMGNGLGNILILLMFTILGYTSAIVAFFRYDVR